MCNNALINYYCYRSELDGKRKAVYDYDNNKIYSYEELDVRANKLANFLLDKFNILKGDRIAFVAGNCVEYLDAYYMTAKTGTILTVYNYALNENELISLINNETPRILFYDELHQNKINKIKERTSIEEYIVLSNNKKDMEKFCYEDIMKYSSNKRKRANIDLEDIQMLIHTGGSTGLPKAAKISYKAILFNCLSQIVTTGLDKDDITYILIPFFHTAAWNTMTLPILLSGGKIVLKKKFDSKIALEIIKKERPTILLGVPTMYREMINESEFDTIDFTCIKKMISGAAPISLDIAQKFWDKGVKFCSGYGMTEAGPNNFTMPVNNLTIEDLRNKGNSIGKPMFFNEVKIIDENENEVNIGEVGELIFRSNLGFSGYWNNDAETEKMIKNGWIYSGDMAKKDEDGFYYIVGRKKNMYITGGENIYPIEIENIILKHPFVDQVYIIGVPDNKWGEVGKALIKLKPGSLITEGEIKEYLKDRLSSIKIPKYIKFVDEIPKNSVGKVLISELISRYCVNN